MSGEYARWGKTSQLSVLMISMVTLPIEVWKEENSSAVNQRNLLLVQSSWNSLQLWALQMRLYCDVTTMTVVLPLELVAIGQDVSNALAKFRRYHKVIQMQSNGFARHSKAVYKLLEGLVSGEDFAWFPPPDGQPSQDIPSPEKMQQNHFWVIRSLTVSLNSFGSYFEHIKWSVEKFNKFFQRLHFV